MRTRITALLVAGVVALSVMSAGLPPIGITVAEDKDSVTVTLPGGWYRAVLDTGELYDFAKTMPWSLHSGAFNDVNKIIVYSVADDDSQEYVGEIELWRQSARTLLERYGLVQQYGYLLVGRCSFELSEPGATTYGTSSMAELTASEQAAIRALFPGIVKAEATPDQAPSVALTNALAVHDALAPYLQNNGPSSTWSGSHTPSECFDLVMNHDAPVMCGMSQLLYAYLATSTRNFAPDDVRKTNLYRYDAIPGIVVNGHSVISLDSSTGWFMFDPFAGVYCTDGDELLSADGIRDMIRADELGDVAVHKRDASTWQPDFSTDPYDYNYFCHFNYIEHLALTGVGGQSPIQIDVGPGATDQAGSQALNGITLIEFANPVNANGTITSCDLWFATNATGVKVGIMRLVSGTTYTCVASVTLGAVQAGAKRTFTVNLPCQAGDLIGVYYATGAIESGAGSATAYLRYEDGLDGQPHTYSTQEAAISVYGTGVGG